MNMRQNHTAQVKTSQAPDAHLHLQGPQAIEKGESWQATDAQLPFLIAWHMQPGPFSAHRLVLLLAISVVSSMQLKNADRDCDLRRRPSAIASFLQGPRGSAGRPSPNTPAARPPQRRGAQRLLNAFAVAAPAAPSAATATQPLTPRGAFCKIMHNERAVSIALHASCHRGHWSQHASLPLLCLTYQYRDMYAGHCVLGNKSGMPAYVLKAAQLGEKP